MTNAAGPPPPSGKRAPERSGRGVSCSAFPRNWCWRVFVRTGTIPSSSGGIDPRGKTSAPGDERRKEMERAIRRQAEWSSAPRSNSVPRVGRFRARVVRVSRRRDQVLKGLWEFPKNSINIDKFTGFFDKLMKRIFPVNNCNILSYVINMSVMDSDISIKKVCGSPRICPQPPAFARDASSRRLRTYDPPGLRAKNSRYLGANGASRQSKPVASAAPSISRAVHSFSSARWFSEQIPARPVAFQWTNVGPWALASSSARLTSASEAGLNSTGETGTFT